MAKGCALSTGYLPRGGLPRNRVDRITDRPDMTSAVDRGRKASTQTKQNRIFHFGKILIINKNLNVYELNQHGRRKIPGIEHSTPNFEIMYLNHFAE